MPKPEQSEKKFDLRVKSKLKNGQRLRVVEIQYVPTPSADVRLSRAIDILLRAAYYKGDEQEALPPQAPTKDTLASGAEEDRPCEE